MHLYASERGAMVAISTWTGSVISRHDGFLNLLHPEGLIVSVLVDPRHVHPFGIRVEPEEFSMIDAQPGSSASMGDGVLTIGRGCTLAVSGASVWSGAVSSCEDRATNPLNVGYLAAAIAAHAGTEGFGSLVTGRAENMFAVRASAVLRAASMQPDLIDLSRLIGLGIGLTPSGDDFLTGVLAAEAALVGSAGCGPIRSIDRGAVAARLQSTSPAGRTLLTGALAGQFPKYLVGVVDALCASPSEAEATLREAVGQASTHGATSGIDSCTGVWWGVEEISGRSGNRFLP